jgi:TolB protein
LGDWGKRLSVFGLALAIVSVAARPAAATFPGENGRIAFRRYFNAEQTWGAVFTIKPDGSGERQVTHPQPGFVDRNPDWSPDGRRIAFERQSDNYDEVFVVNADGTGLHQLTHNRPGKSCDTGGTCNSSPAWSPDGKQITSPARPVPSAMTSSPRWRSTS